MIVIVIVGVLSAVALPNFLGQQNKAKATEATSKLTALLKEAHADYQLDADEAAALATANKSGDKAKDTGKFNYTLNDAGTTTTIYGEAQAWGTNSNAVPASGTPGDDGTVDNSLVTATNITGGAEVIAGCINLDTGEIKLSRGFVDQKQTTPAFPIDSCV